MIEVAAGGEPPLWSELSCLHHLSREKKPLVWNENKAVMVEAGFGVSSLPTSPNAVVANFLHARAEGPSFDKTGRTEFAFRIDDSRTLVDQSDIYSRGAPV